MKKIPLKSKGIIVAYCLVDDEDYDFLVQNYYWSLNRDGYPTGMLKHNVKTIGRALLNPPNDKVVDHINGNPLDNQRSNLRICTKAENQMNKRMPKHNTSGVRGVYWGKSVNKWIAEIKCYKKKYHLGCFEKIEDAAKARKEAEEKYFGEFNLK